MNTLKILFWIAVAAVAILLFGKLTGYDARMKAYNKYMCANYGYYEDCKTPLRPEDRLK